MSRLLTALCHLRGHWVESRSGVCLRCHAQVFPPLDQP